MEIGDVYRDKDVKNIHLKILSMNGDDCEVIFNRDGFDVFYSHDSIAKNIFNYKISYVEEFYEQFNF